MSEVADEVVLGLDWTGTYHVVPLSTLTFRFSSVCQHMSHLFLWTAYPFFFFFSSHRKFGISTHEPYLYPSLSSVFSRNNSFYPADRKSVV